MVLVEMAALEHIGVISKNGVNTLKIGTADVGMTAEIHIETLVDEGAFENINDRSGHIFRLNGGELLIRKQGREEDAYPEIVYTVGHVKLLYFFEMADYEEIVAHLLANTVAPIEGGRRRRRTRRRRAH
jgi:hypothetical protein